MFFCADKRPALKKEQPDLKVRHALRITIHVHASLPCHESHVQITEMASVLGAQWKELDDKGEAKYQAQAEKDKERYAKEMAAYKP